MEKIFLQIVQVRILAVVVVEVVARFVRIVVVEILAPRLLLDFCAMCKY